MKIFLVDDSIYIRQRLVRMLTSIKEVEIIGEAGEATEASLAIQKLKPDVVLLDIHLLGKGTGIDVLHAIKQGGVTSVVIVLTTYPYPQYQKTCLDAGAEFFFDKATQFDQVVPIVERLAHQDAIVKNAWVES